MKISSLALLLIIFECNALELNKHTDAKIIENIANSSVLVIYKSNDSNEFTPNIGLLVEKGNLIMVTDDKIMEANQIYIVNSQDGNVHCDLVAYDYTRGVALLKSNKLIKGIDPLKLNFQSEFLKNTNVIEHLKLQENSEITNSLQNKNSWKFILDTPESVDSSEYEILMSIEKSNNNPATTANDITQNSVAKQPSASESTTYLKGLTK